MSDFEYASVVVSIVLALGIADILRFFADSFHEKRERNLYWVHLLWVALLLQLHVEFWWRMWSFKDVVTVGPSLALVLLGPAMLFVATRTLLPAGTSEPDFQAVYFRRKTPFFVWMALLNIWALILSSWGAEALSSEGTAFAMAAFALVMILIGACIFTSNRIVHQGVVILIVVFELAEIISAI